MGVSVALIGGCGHSDNGSANTNKGAGFINSFQIISSAPAFGGATPAGAAGPYQVITAVVHGELDPNNPLNAGIVNIKNAPVGSDGVRGLRDRCRDPAAPKRIDCKPRAVL